MQLLLIQSFWFVNNKLKFCKEVIIYKSLRFLEALYFMITLLCGKIHTSGSDLMFESVSVISNVILILGQNFLTLNFMGFC